MGSRLAGVESRKIFVVGTGRSGTHWLGATLAEHPDVRATIEQSPFFGRATAAAVDPRRKPLHLPYLRVRYTWEHARSRPRHYVDKTHANLWHAETLARYFPQARFIAMRRGVYGTVASMMRHNGVLRWQRVWRRYPVPNRFLGITEEVATFYDELPLAAQCALRWKAHDERIQELVDSLGGRFLVVEYERMADEYDTEACRVWEFLELQPRPITIAVKTGSRDQWRQQLSADDIAAIESVVSGRLTP